ncbi:transposase family protein [Streptomyces arenae]|uniref:transposase family protein n=1 Tax=Streptomyces arenae TaxID=29301 RepID=UPI00265A6A55|nr:transposase family protein [Streptomyces arenae]MCG7205171.1 transposase family protein [Streptomyces arenae]
MLPVGSTVTFRHGRGGSARPRGGAACPDCGRFSDRVHDRYQRRLKGLPLAELGFVIRLTVRRFICGVADCPRRTFAEPFSRLAAQLGFGAGRMTQLPRPSAPLEHPVGRGCRPHAGFGTPLNSPMVRHLPMDSALTWTASNSFAGRLSTRTQVLSVGLLHAGARTPDRLRGTHA